MRNYIEENPKERRADNKEISALLNAAIDFAKQGNELIEGESLVWTNTVYTKDGRLITVTVFSNNPGHGIIIAELESVVSCVNKATQVCFKSMRQINMTVGYYRSGKWQVGIYNLDEKKPTANGIPQSVSQQITSLLESYIFPNTSRSTNSIEAEIFPD